MNRLAPRLLALRQRLQALLGIADWQSTLLWALLAGVLGALATELFRRLLSGLDRAVFGRVGDLVDIAGALPDWARVAAPTVGGLLAGLLLELAHRVGARKTVSDYMEAIVLGDGRIPVAQTLARSASSLVSIASGGSIGREGSMVQLAALGASLLGRAIHFPAHQLRLLVACGAAAGLTAAYSAPIAGAFFVAEVVLGSIAMESVGPVMLASVVANITMRQFPGYQPTYAMPEFPAIYGTEVLLFGLLGVIVGAAAALFLRGLTLSRSLFARVPVPLPVRLMLGGLLVGLVSVAVPQVWGNGYGVVNLTLHTSLPWILLLTLLAAKGAATFATVGSGAIGGVFTPALFFGCITGTLFGQTAQALWPEATSAPFAYAVVGMGAFLAGATQAPLMAILMIFEMTLSYEVMLPLMAASVVAYFVARSTNAGSMYAITERRRERDAEHVRLKRLTVRDLIEPAQTVVAPQAGVEQMSALFLQYPVKYLYVADEHDVYLGVVPLKALSAASLAARGLAKPTARDLLADDIQPIAADMSLGDAMHRFLEHRGERLPAIESEHDRRLMGAVSKSRLLSTYVRLSE